MPEASQAEVEVEPKPKPKAKMRPVIGTGTQVKQLVQTTYEQMNILRIPQDKVASLLGISTYRIDRLLNGSSDASVRLLAAKLVLAAVHAISNAEAHADDARNNYLKVFLNGHKKLMETVIGEKK